jgi:hypothetical protein
MLTNGKPRIISLGAKVRWIAGATSLSGTVIGFVEGFVTVQTPDGIFEEYPGNLEVIEP